MQYACIMRFRREANESQLPVAGRDVRAAHRTASLSFARLMRDHSLAEIARRFDRSATWVSRRLALVELLPESIQHQVREGKIAAQVAMKFLVPVARQSLEDCQRRADHCSNLGRDHSEGPRRFAALCRTGPLRQSEIEQLD